MQSTPVLSTASNSLTQPQRQSYFQQQSYRERNDLTIEYSGQGGDLFLHMSTDILYSSSIYTENGYMAPENSEANAFPTSSLLTEPFESSGTPSVGSDSLPTFDTLLQKYYELILERVTYLLGEISNNPAGSSQTGETGGISVAYIESLSVSNSLTIGGTVADPNYFSAEKTAERIISFALSFYDGGDRGEYADMVRDAVTKGFNEALGALGGYLPEISYTTIGIVNRAIDQFSESQTVDTRI